MRGTLVAVVLLLAPGLGTAETPHATSVLRKVGFSSEDQQRILDGQFAEAPLPSTTDRDLAVALAFLVPVGAEDFDRKLIRDSLLIRDDPNTLARGDLQGQGSLASFAGLSLSRSERAVYAHASPGKKLNFSTAELAALKRLGGVESGVDAELRKILLGRYQSYRSQGLAGIAPYDRGDSEATDAAAELRHAGEAARALELLDPAFYQLLRSYPAGRPADLEEVFHWSRYEAHGEPTLILTHSFSSAAGNSFVFVQRQFYVSRGYDVEQAVAGLIPVKEGTLVVYTNHTFTGEVSGLGGGAKRSIGERLMASQLRDLFEKVRASAAQP